jgi:hypothetical protein
MNLMWGKSLITHWEDDKGFRTLFSSYPSIMPCTGMNEHGLALTWHSGGLWDRNLPIPGLPAYALIYAILHQKNVKDALAWIGDKTNAGWFSFFLCDTVGDIGVIEGAPGLMRGMRSQAYNCQHWHYYHPDIRNATKQEGPGMSVPVWHREGRMLQLLASGLGRMDHEFIQTMLRDNAPDCAIDMAPRNFSDPDNSMTVESLYYSPVEKKGFFARGPAQHHEFTAISL